MCLYILHLICIVDKLTTLLMQTEYLNIKRILLPIEFYLLKYSNNLSPNEAILRRLLGNKDRHISFRLEVSLHYGLFHMTCPTVPHVLNPIPSKFCPKNSQHL